jgi:hypothetical protein
LVASLPAEPAENIRSAVRANHQVLLSSAYAIDLS